jgi:hypothetical protein
MLIVQGVVCHHGYFLPAVAGKYGFTNFNRKLKMLKIEDSMHTDCGCPVTGVASGQELQIRLGHFFKAGMLYTGHQQVYFDSVPSS